MNLVSSSDLNSFFSLNFSQMNEDEAEFTASFLSLLQQKAEFIYQEKEKRVRLLQLIASAQCSLLEKLESKILYKKKEEALLRKELIDSDYFHQKTIESLQDQTKAYEEKTAVLKQSIPSKIQSVAQQLFPGAEVSVHSQNGKPQLVVRW
jgi:hypothetical protein